MGKMCSKKTSFGSLPVTKVISNGKCWFPGSSSPSYLDGKLAGDVGFDPLGLGSYEESLKWFRESELQHCRWSMVGVAGILVGEMLNPKINFYKAPLQLEGTFRFPLRTLLAIEILLLHYVELRRFQDFRKPGSVDRDPIFKDMKLPDHEVGYPGGIFDPLGISKSGLEALKVKEIKNGRLAMVSYVGIIAQELVTGLNPLSSLQLHLSEPAKNTIFSSWASSY